MPSRPQVVIPDDVNGSFGNAPETGRLRGLADVKIHDSRPHDDDELVQRVLDADVIISFRPAFTRFPAHVLAACNRLRLICISGTGVEDVDVGEATKRGIAVANVVGAANSAVAELCLALMLDVARHVSAQDRSIRKGEWRSREGIELGGKTLGIVGLSGIARQLIPLARGLGMSVLSWSRNNDPARAAQAGSQAVEFGELLERSDVVSLHLRLAPETRGLLDAEAFARMKPGAILINTARGPIVDETALIDALESGRLRGAGLDVFAQEPLPAGHPFMQIDNIVMTPVSAWSTADASTRMIAHSIDNVTSFLQGRPTNVVNLDHLDRERLGVAVRP